MRFCQAPGVGECDLFSRLRLCWCDESYCNRGTPFCFVLRVLTDVTNKQIASQSNNLMAQACKTVIFGNQLAFRRCWVKVISARHFLSKHASCALHAALQTVLSTLRHPPQPVSVPILQSWRDPRYVTTKLRHRDTTSPRSKQGRQCNAMFIVLDTIGTRYTFYEKLKCACNKETRIHMNGECGLFRRRL